MHSKPSRRPFSLALRLTFYQPVHNTGVYRLHRFMLHSVEKHFAEQDVSDLQQISTTLSRILQSPADPMKKSKQNKGINCQLPQRCVFAPQSLGEVLFSSAQGRHYARQ